MRKYDQFCLRVCLTTMAQTRRRRAPVHSRRRRCRCNEKSFQAGCAMLRCPVSRERVSLLARDVFVVSCECKCGSRADVARLLWFIVVIRHPALWSFLMLCPLEMCLGRTHRSSKFRRNRVERAPDVGSIVCPVQPPWDWSTAPLLSARDERDPARAVRVLLRQLLWLPSPLEATCPCFAQLTQEPHPRPQPVAVAQFHMLPCFHSAPFLGFGS